jgi:NADPH:quinone reductase-like Zn-dependent oxidoreductase
VNSVDGKIRSGYLRGTFPHYLPLIPGWDVAGVVLAVGPAVADYAPGDEVMGYVRKDYLQHGSYAERLAAPERTLAHKPPSLSFEVAGSLPLVGLTALQALRAADVRAGDTVLVHAAAGGVGHLAIQLARELGAARVIGTASEDNHEFVRSLGGEPVVYGDGLVDRVAAMVGGGGKVDAVLDLVGGDASAVSPQLVRQLDRHVSIVNPQAIQQGVIAQGGRYVFVKPNHDQLEWLGQLAASAKLHVEIQQTFPLEQASDAHREIDLGHVRGKLVLTVSD